MDVRPSFAECEATDDDEIDTQIHARALPLVQKVERIRPAPRPSTSTAPRAVVTPPAREMSSLPKTSPRLTMPSSIDVPPPPSELFKNVAPQPVPVAPVARPASIATPPVTAPAWSLPAVPQVTAKVPERKELPSFGPVAFDLESELATKLEPDTHGKTRSRVIVSAAAAAATLCLMIGQYFVMAKDTQAVAPASAAAYEAPTSEPITAPNLAPSVALPKLTPTEIFPPSAVAIKVPTKAAPRSSDTVRFERARIAMDLAKRNAQVLYVPSTEPIGFGPAVAPGVDELLRAPRLRGEKD